MVSFFLNVLYSTVDGSTEVVKDKSASDASSSISEKAEGVDQAGNTVPSHSSISAALSNAGHLLEGAELELVLRPLKLAFETKNARLVELALDCLHVYISDAIMLWVVLHNYCFYYGRA